MREVRIEIASQADTLFRLFTAGTVSVSTLLLSVSTLLNTAQHLSVWERARLIDIKYLAFLCSGFSISFSISG